MSRKVYIATRKDPETRRAVFAEIGREFSTVEKAEEAEFIILDCDEPAAFRDWINQKLSFVVPETSYPPIVLFASQDYQRFREQLANVYDGDTDILPVCGSSDELLKRLKQLEAALPFYNSKNAPPIDQAKVREMALAIIRAVPGRSPE